MVDVEHLVILRDSSADQINRWREMHPQFRFDLSAADLSGRNLSLTDLGRSNLRGVNLSRAKLRGGNLSDSDLRGANLREADLIRCYLAGADLSRADLTRAILTETDLTETNLDGADLSGAVLVETEPDLIEVRGPGEADVTAARSSRHSGLRAPRCRQTLRMSFTLSGRHPAQGGHVS